MSIQYRAMFVLNCKINDKEVLRYKKKKRKTRKRKKEKIQDRRRKSRSRSRSLNRASDATDTDAEDLYHPGMDNNIVPSSPERRLIFKLIFSDLQNM